jgi:hypothetical protein
MNVIGARPDGWWRDRAGAQRALANRLALLAGDTGEEVYVVFDGRPVAIDPDCTGRVGAEWAGPGRDAADARIAERAERDADPSTLRVVTSDGALASRARAAGADVMGAGAFRRRLDGLTGSG